MPPSWTEGRQEAEKKKLASSAGWTPYPTVKEEDGDKLSVGPFKRPRREPKPTFKLGSSSAAPPRRGRRSESSTSTSPATAVPTSVARVQAVAGLDSSQVAAAAAAAAVKEGLLPVVRKGKRKRAAPAYLYDEAGSAGVGRNAAVAAKRTPVSKTKTLTKGKGKGKMVPKSKGKENKSKAKKKAAVVKTPVVSSADEVIAANDGGGAQEMYALACAFEGDGHAIDAPAFADDRGSGDAMGAPDSADEGGGGAMEAPASAGGGGGQAVGATGGGGGQALPVHGLQGIVLPSEARRAIDYYNAEMNRIRQLNQHMLASGVADWVV